MVCARGMPSRSAGVCPRQTSSARAAQVRFSAAQIHAVACRPCSGMATNTASRTPATAPAVLPAYSRGSSERRAVRNCRSSAGSVPPMAKVAGSSSASGKPNASAPCTAADGSGPIQRATGAAMDGSSSVTPRPQPAIRTSSSAYQRDGRVLRSMGPESRKEPAARPPKKAPSTASTAMTSWPSATPKPAVQSICQTRPQAPEVKTRISASDVRSGPAAIADDRSGAMACSRESVSKIQKSLDIGPGPLFQACGLSARLPPWSSR